MYTFWDYMRNRWPPNAGLRLDHLLLSAKAAKRLTDGGVDTNVRAQQGASDHAPAWVALRDEGMRPTSRKVSRFPVRQAGRVRRSGRRAGRYWSSKGIHLRTAHITL
jgi:hypothetical protein